MTAMSNEPKALHKILRFRADQLRAMYDDNCTPISRNEIRLIECAIRGVADGPEITRDDDYVREVQRVSELLNDFDDEGRDQFSTVSSHLEDLLRRVQSVRVRLALMNELHGQAVDEAEALMDAATNSAERDITSDSVPHPPSSRALSEEEADAVAVLRFKVERFRSFPLATSTARHLVALIDRLTGAPK